MVLGLLTNYLELRSNTPPAPEEQLLARSCLTMNESFCFIPLGGKRATPGISAVISPEDYSRVIEISDSWRLSSTGYVVAGTRDRITKRYKLMYLHKVISNGESSKHANGDRLDNRRSNLVSTTHSPLTLHLKTVPCCLDSCYGVLDCPENAAYASVQYEEGKQYSGGFQHYRPHGYGILYEYESCTLSIGIWKSGCLQNGLVLRCTPFPPRMQDEEETRRRAFRSGITSGFLVTNQTEFYPLDQKVCKTSSTSSCNVTQSSS